MNRSKYKQFISVTNTGSKIQTKQNKQNHMNNKVKLVVKYVFRLFWTFSQKFDNNG